MDYLFFSQLTETDFDEVVLSVGGRRYTEDPTIQDLNCDYIKKWVPELEKIKPKIIHNLWNEFPNNLNCVKPMVIHKIEAEKTKMIFKSQ